MIYAIVFGIIAGLFDNNFINILSSTICEIFIRLFKCLSLPLIFLSIVTVLFKSNDNFKQIIKKASIYTVGTTIIASTISFVLYLIINPSITSTTQASTLNFSKTSYIDCIISIVPSNIFSPYLENNVIAVLIMGVFIGFVIRFLENDDHKTFLINLFNSFHLLLLKLINCVIKILPIGIFGFVTSTVLKMKSGLEFIGIFEYLLVIVLSNLVQGFIVLPIWLKLNKINPFQTMKAMLPALSVAFFSKSSSGTLPITIEMTEKNLNIRKDISRLVLPLCTTINMNGCAAFIFTTVMYLMKANGIIADYQTMILWIFVSTIAAVGNAGVPMGCFFLSASLLSAMDVPISLLGVILPFYGVIDMIETSLNVWSDACVTAVLNKKV